MRNDNPCKVPPCNKEAPCYTVHMPTRNIVKEYGAQEFYHAYNRGVAKQDIFRSAKDYEKLLTLLRDRLSPTPKTDAFGRPIANFADKVSLVAYCLMPNHYHMLFYLKEPEGLEQLMRSLMTAYSMYFNKRHGRVGSLFQNHFLASRITDEPYLWQVSRYIHLNPLDIAQDPFGYPYSSIEYFVSTSTDEWIDPSLFVADAAQRKRYRNFVADYTQAHQELHRIKHELANRV